MDVGEVLRQASRYLCIALREGEVSSSDQEEILEFAANLISPAFAGRDLDTLDHYSYILGLCVAGAQANLIIERQANSSRD